MQIGETWVFVYSEAPVFSMDALGGGDASAVDGCLVMGEPIVVWRPEHLDTVEEIVAAVESGESPALVVGGGGESLDEGSSREDFPDSVLEHCEPTALWYAADGEITVDGGS